MKTCRTVQSLVKSDKDDKRVAPHLIACVEGAEDCASTEPKLKPVRAALAGAAAVPPNKAGVDAAGAPNARGEDAAAFAAMPKDRGVEAAVEGRGVLMARAKGADAAAEAVLAGVLDAVLVEAAAEDCPKAPNAGADWLDAAAD
ncbi:MAG: hypothetical protein FRX49_00438 [Trebouxia sp. A1-2]|nr:MAG: hypothetical protein FRX49_00438 [Trebouxia sp. A1-2]